MVEKDYIFSGTVGNPNLRMELAFFLNRIGIKTSYGFDSENSFYYINSFGKIDRVSKDSFKAQALLKNRKLVDISTFFELLKEQELNDPNKWYLNLKVGDLVTIADKKDGIYPIEFSPNHINCIGKTFVIKSIETSIFGINPFATFFNNDFVLYYLEGIKVPFHSSMFEHTIIPVKKLEICEIPIKLI